SVVHLRDAALNLVEGLDLHYTGREWILRHTALNASDNGAIHAELAKRFATLERLPEQKPVGQAKPVRVRLNSRFTHDDVAVFFGGCGGHDGHKIEAEVARLKETRALLPEQLPPVELMGYKVALVAQLLRDFDSHADLFKKGTPDRRKQWVGMAMDLEQAA